MIRVYMNTQSTFIVAVRGLLSTYTCMYVCKMLPVYILYHHRTLLFVVCVFIVVHTTHTVVVHKQDT